MTGLASEADAAQTERLRVAAMPLCEAHRTAEELVTAFVRNAIVQGIYRPGERLRQDVIAEVLGISRIPLRAGLRQLEEEGLLTILPHRGAVVAALRPEEIREIYELRAVLECYLLDHAFPALRAEGLGALRALVPAPGSINPGAETVESRLAFYEQLYSLADRPRTLKLVSRLRSEVGPYLLKLRVVDDPSGHFPLLRYLEDGSLDAAKEWLRHHLAQVSGRMQALVASPLNGSGWSHESRAATRDRVPTTDRAIHEEEENVHAEQQLTS